MVKNTDRGVLCAKYGVVSFAMEKSLISKKKEQKTLLRGFTIQTTFSNSIAYKVSQANTM